MTSKRKQSEEIIQNFLRPIVRKWLDALYHRGEWNCHCQHCWSITFTDMEYCKKCVNEMEEEDQEPKCIMCGDDAMMDGTFCRRSCLRAYNRGD